MLTIARLWQRLPGKYFFLATKSKAGVWKDHAFTKNQFDELEDFVEQHSDHNLYFCPHGFTKPWRLSKYAVPPRLLWADLDNVDPRKLNGTKPSMAWESSPGRYAGIWVINKTMEPLLNKRLTYTLGADPGGWDMTQVLRIPGTTNYKYGKGVPGKQLWFKPEPIDVSKLERHLRDDVDEAGAPGATSSDAGEVFKKYAKRIRPKYRAMLLAKKAIGDRSARLWELGYGLIEAGLDKDEWLTLIASTVWNKFKDRPHQLDREYEKILASKLSGSSVTGTKSDTRTRSNDDDDTPVDRVSLMDSIKWLSEVEEKDVQWIIPGWIPSNVVTILEGDPGIGKSWIAQYFSICIVDQRRFPVHNQYGCSMTPQRGTVLYIDLENDPEMVTKKRLRWMGITDKGEKYIGIYDKGMDLNDPDQLEELRTFLRNLFGSDRQVRLIVIDTIAAYLGEIDAHNSKEVSQFMAEMMLIAKEFQLGVLMLRHLAKASSGRSAIMAGMGSMSFVGMARMLLRVAEHPNEQGMYVMKQVKSSLERKEPALKFQLAEGKRQGKEIPTFLSFDGFDTSVTDEQLGVIDKNKKKEDPLSDAKIWLVSKLGDGPEYVSVLQTECERRNKPFKWTTVEKAANELGVERKNVHGKKQWVLKNGGKGTK